MPSKKDLKRKRMFFNNKTSPSPPVNKVPIQHPIQRSHHHPVSYKDNFHTTNGFDVITSAQAKNIGTGKRGKIYFYVPKDRLNIKPGNIVKMDDGLYIVDKISMGCSAVRTATVYCSAYNPSNLSNTKILVPKKY
jgi:hypothetical protein